MGRHRLRPATVALCAAALAGCGATPPQAPGPEAHRLNLALSAFSDACGHAAEVQAFSRSARDMTILEDRAEAQVPVVASIHRRNRHWIFLGKSVEQLVQMSTSYLDECGLHQAAQRLRAATSG